jgi:hypothetical protein
MNNELVRYVIECPDKSRYVDDCRTRPDLKINKIIGYFKIIYVKEEK